MANHRNMATMCGPSVRAGVDYLERLFATPRARGVNLAVENVTGAIPEDEVRALMPAYLGVLLTAYRRGGVGGHTPGIWTGLADNAPP